MKRQIVFLIMLLLTMVANANVVEINGVFYSLFSDGDSAIVTKNPNYYSGDIIIPEFVKFETKEYKVTSIESFAFYGCINLTSVVIPNSTTSIGERAFRGCSNMVSVILSNNITSILPSTFEGCKSLISVVIPYGVNEICTAAFSGCSNLSTVEIPNSVTTIKNLAFENCTNLRSLVIPNSVTSIWQDAFYNCTNLMNLAFEDGEKNLKFELKYSSNSNPNWFTNCSLDSIYIGRNIDYSFLDTNVNQTNSLSPFRENKTLRKVVFGNIVKNVPIAMFIECSNLESVNLSERTIEIGWSAFYNCESLFSINIPNGIQEIQGFTFYGCKALSSVSIPESVQIIRESAFSNCGSLTSLTIPANVVEIEKQAYAGCLNLSTLMIKDSKTNLFLHSSGRNYQSVFAQCPIKEIYLGRNTNDGNTSSLGFFTTPFKLTISKNVTKLSGATFAQCQKITSLMFEEGEDTLTFIKEHNVYSEIMPFDMTSIDSVYLGRIIVGYDRYYPNRTIIPFSNVNSPFAVRIGNLNEIGSGALSKWSISSVIIPNTIEKIGSASFANCSSLKSVIIEDGGTPIDFGIVSDLNICFNSCPIDSLYLGRDINYSQNSPFKKNAGISSIIFGDNVTVIGDAMFLGFSKLKTLNLPNNLVSIGRQAFYGCEGLTSLSIPNNVTSIGQQAFDLCKGIKKLFIEDGLEKITFLSEQNQLNNAFANSPIEEIYLGRNIDYSNMSPFFAMEPLKILTIGNTVTTFKDRLFAGCSNLKDVYSYTETVPSVGQSVFTESNLSLATLYVPYSLYDMYKIVYPWSKFGRIKNFERKYNLIYLVNGIEYKRFVLEEGSIIIPEPQPDGDYENFIWIDLPQTMPDHDVVVYASYTTGMAENFMGNQCNTHIFSPAGKKLDKLQKGLNIVTNKDNSTRKVLVK